MNDSSPPGRRGHRLGFLVVVALLAVGVIFYVRSQPELDSNLKGMFTMLPVLVAILLGLVWFFFLSRFKMLTRFAGFVVVAGLVYGMVATLRVDGAINGTGIPKFVWKWTPKHEVSTLPATKAAPASTPSRSDVADVPQFFGPERDGVVHGAHLDTDWAANPPKLLWRQPVGLGWGAFAVSGGRAFTLEQRGEDEIVSCYDVGTGALVWAHPHPKTRFAEWQGGDGPRSIPTISNGKVYAMGATGILDCLNIADGSQVWSRNVLTDNNQSNLMWGKSCSPLVFDDKVVVTGGEKKDDSGKDMVIPCVFAYNRDSGSPVWQSGTDKGSYGSPVLVTLAGKRVVLSANASNLSAHDPATGKALLTHAWGIPNWPRAAQPLVLPGDRVFLSAGYGNGCLMLQIKAGTDGQLTATELWSSHKMKTQFNSVHLLNGHIYGIDDGTLACMDAANGERLWKDGHFGAGQSLLVDDTVLIQSEHGDVVLVAAKPDSYKELARLPALSSKTWNHPVLAGRYLLVRNDQEMACYELALAK